MAQQQGQGQGQYGGGGGGWGGGGGGRGYGGGGGQGWNNGGGGGGGQWGGGRGGGGGGWGGGGGRQQGGSWNANAPAFAPGTAGGDGGATVPLQPDNPAGSGPSMVVRPGQHLTPTQQSQFVAGAALAGLRRTGQSSRHDALFLPANLRADLAREAAAAAFAGHPNDTRLEELFSVQARARRPRDAAHRAAPSVRSPRPPLTAPFPFPSIHRSASSTRSCPSTTSPGGSGRGWWAAATPPCTKRPDVDGETYVLRCVEGATAPAEGMQRAAGWHALSHPNLVGLKEVFVSDELADDGALYHATPHQHPKAPSHHHATPSRLTPPSFPYPSRRPRHLFRRGVLPAGADGRGVLHGQHLGAAQRGGALVARPPGAPPAPPPPPPPPPPLTTTHHHLTSTTHSLTSPPTPLTSPHHPCRPSRCWRRSTPCTTPAPPSTRSTRAASSSPSEGRARASRAPPSPTSSARRCVAAADPAVCASRDL